MKIFKEMKIFRSENSQRTENSQRNENSQRSEKKWREMPRSDDLWRFACGDVYYYYIILEVYGTSSFFSLIGRAVCAMSQFAQFVRFCALHRQ